MQPAKVKQFTIAKLFNLGNYEHERIELTIEVGDRDAGEAFNHARSILERLNPTSPVSTYELEQARRLLNKTAIELNACEREGINNARSVIDAKSKFEDSRREALAELNTL